MDKYMDKYGRRYGIVYAENHKPVPFKVEEGDGAVTYKEYWEEEPTSRLQVATVSQ
jgi:hypothetical protein